MIILLAAVVLLVLLFIAYRKSGVFKKLVDSINPINMVLSAQHEYVIKDLHPRYQNVFRRFIYEVEQEGWSVILTSGYRSFQKQAQLKAQDSRNASPGMSLHNYGLAIDINAQRGTTVLRKKTSRKAWLDSGIVGIAEKLGLRWGGDFPGYPDHVHFDVKMKGSELLARARKQFGNNNSKIIGNRIELA